MNTTPNHDELPALTQEDLDDILTRHNDYITGVVGGLRALVQYKNLSGLNFSKVDLSQADFTGSNLSNCDLSHSNFSGAVFFACDLQHANLEQSNFSNADFRGACVIGANLWGADLAKADMREGQIMLSGRDGEMVARQNAAGSNGQTKLNGAKMANTDMSGLRAHNADFSDADLAGAKITQADLSSADFTGANLSDSDLSGSDLSHVNLTDSIINGAVLEQMSARDLDLSGVIIDENTGKRLESVGKTFEELLADHKAWVTSAGQRGEPLDLSDFDLRDVLNLGAYPLTAIRAVRANFIKQNLSGAAMQSVVCDHADFRDCRMEDADLRGSRFRGANFSRVNLRDAILCPLEFQKGAEKIQQRTDFHDVDFSHAVLEGADLRHCILTGANFTHANLSGADLRGADLSGAILDSAMTQDVLIDNAIIDQGVVIEEE